MYSDSPISVETTVASARLVTEEIKRTMRSQRAAQDKLRSTSWANYRSIRSLTSTIASDRKAFQEMWSFIDVDDYKFSQDKFLFFREMDRIRLANENLRSSLPIEKDGVMSPIPFDQEFSELRATTRICKRIHLSRNFYNLYAPETVHKGPWGYVVDNQNGVSIFFQSDKQYKFSIDELWVLESARKDVWYIMATMYERVLIMDPDYFVGMEISRSSALVPGYSWSKLAEEYPAIAPLMYRMEEFDGTERRFPIMQSRHVKDVCSELAHYTVG